MITVFNPYNHDIKTFQSVEGLFKYITNLENKKMLEDHEHFGKTEWSFVVFSRQHVRDLYKQVKKEDVTEALRETYEQELELIEISHGDCRNLASFPFTSNIDLIELKMDWCRAYCKAHQFYLAEV